MNTKETTPFLSVIIPVHNAEQYLETALDTVQNQNFSDIEIICINDASTDSSEEILTLRALQDSRLKIININGHNAGIARNTGLANAQGKYILFLDSDDFLEPGTFNDLHDIALANDLDILLFGGRRYDQAKQELAPKIEFVRADLAPSGVFEATDAPINLFQLTTPAPWNKLYKRSVLKSNELEFQTLANAEDLYFSLSALALSKRIMAIDGDYIRYRVNTGGENIETRKKETPLCFFEALEALKTKLVEANLFERLHLSFCEQVLSTTKYNLETAGSYFARTQILKALSDNPLDIRSYLDYNNVLYPSNYAYNCARFISAALTQYKTTLLEAVGDSLSKPKQISDSEGLIQNEAPMVSIIIPVFNDELYIPYTLESILKQTYSDYEVICIDDGSSDNSLHILEEYSKKDARIKVYTQENSGLSITRNHGQDLSRGSYIMFLDGDDMLSPDALQKLIQKVTSENLDILLFNSDVFYDDKELETTKASYKTYYKRSKEYKNIYSGIDLLFEMEETGDYLPSACFMITNSEFLRTTGLRFHPGILHEDNSHTYALMLCAKRASHIDQSFYQRRIHADSIMTKESAFANVYGYYACWQDMIRTAISYCDVKVMDDALFKRLTSLPSKARESAINIYNRIPQSEKGALCAMDNIEKYSFMQAIDSIATLRAKKIEAERKTQALRKQLKKAKDSAVKLKQCNSFKIGRAITAPARKIKRLMKH